MRIVLRESAHPQQAMQHAGSLISIDRSEFSIADGQISIASQMGLVNHDMERTIHRLELVLTAFHFHGSEHVFTVIINVAAGLPEIKPRDVGGIDQLIPMPNMLFAPKIFNQQPDRSRLSGCQSTKPGTDVILNRDQIELFSDLR